MIIDVRIEVLLIKFIDKRCPLLWDVEVSQVLADNSTMLGFD